MLRHGFMDIFCKLLTNVQAVWLSEPADTQDPFRITVKKGGSDLGWVTENLESV